MLKGSLNRLLPEVLAQSFNLFLQPLNSLFSILGLTG